MDLQDNAKKLSTDDLQQVSGGGGEHLGSGKFYPPCPECGCTDVFCITNWFDGDGHLYYELHCNVCYNEWVWQEY